MATDKTAVAVLAALTGAGYSPADIITYLSPPPPPPASQIATFAIGLNSVGVDDPAADPVVHPEIAATLSHFGMQYMRLWMTGPISGAVPASKWAIAGRYASIGVKPVVVINFQNSAVRCKAPAMSDWLTYLNALPPPDTTGVWAFEIGNEVDYTTYYSDTLANYAALLQAAYPILRAKGYKVVCANVLYNLNAYKTLNSLGAFAFCDYIGGHFYYANAAGALSAYDSLIAFAAGVGKPVLCTEVGLHGNVSTPSTWANELAKLWTGLKARSGTFLYFMLFTNTSNAGPESLLVANTYQNNGVFYTALEAALGV